MGTSHSPQEFARKIHELAAATEKSQRAAVTAGAQATKAIMLGAASARGMTPGSKIAGKRWTVRYDLAPGLNSALVRFTGPFHLVERSTKAHEIVPRKGSKRRRGGQGKALRIGDQFRSSVSHPGTRGKHIFAAGRSLAGERIPRLMATHIGGAWKRVIH